MPHKVVAVLFGLAFQSFLLRAPTPRQGEKGDALICECREIDGAALAEREEDTTKQNPGGISTTYLSIVAKREKSIVVEPAGLVERHI